MQKSPQTFKLSHSTLSVLSYQCTQGTSQGKILLGTRKTMAALTALRSGLQEEVFDPSDEKLFAFTNVSRAGKKRKPSFLCIAGRSLKTCKRDM